MEFSGTYQHYGCRCRANCHSADGVLVVGFLLCSGEFWLGLQSALEPAKEFFV